ncbi:hypothetical protein SPRG_05224 [Saprolegnia parasitica CBS 223.65]|uniref:Ribosomal RNA large subunit methyltransferase K/L-like methyltransferase domain-containing protein n=1 Tax=Saprolegnia parasitica (strain CBS 223.65) TaxID=695850 RepID=A0A067CH08_SAPPC|nr:hypothetical protein SPRG_05224 [Saprolegnia parasitica CBS 223.65]KDO30034.1 hypothetical protein SPRG_05224 [Saprolegnia parasitica CBS 223.65]|eukprot:XP_012199216.1 hypothetical protein SPRG_05224 [Saprolegnia parasitica CBS 223.65]
MQVHCLALGRHLELVTEELRAIAGLYGETNLQIHDEPSLQARFFRVDFSSEAMAKCIVARCVLIQAAYEVLATQESVVALATQLEAHCFARPPATTVDVKMPKKRLRGPKDKRAVLGRLASFDVESFVSEQSLPASTHLCVLIQDDGRALLSRLVGHGLSPTSGGHGGRVGSGLAANYALHKRPYTGVTTMDPELALVMANLAQVRAGDWVVDPFAGSGGILLACAHFGIGLGIAHDVSFRSLQGDGPGRDMAANFAEFAFPSPERCLHDVRRDMWRPNLHVDAIVCDPPYNIRTFGAAGEDVLENQLLQPLIALAARRLAPQGRLVCYVCVAGDADLTAYLESALANTTLRLTATIAQVVTGKDNAHWSRSLVVLQQAGSRPPLPLSTTDTTPATSEWAAARELEWCVARTRRPFDVWRAAWVGDLPSLQAFAADGGDVDVRDEKGKTPLFFACGYNQSAVVAFLLAQLADPNRCDNDGTSPLSQAARFGHVHVLQQLLDAGADPCVTSKKRWSPAYFAASHNHSEVVMALYAHDATSLHVRGPGDQTILHRAAECGHLELLRAVLALDPALATARDFHQRHFAMAAARAGHAAVVEAFATDDRDAYGETLLHEAARFGRIDVASFLVAQRPWMVSAVNDAGDVPSDLCHHEIFQTT